MRGEDNSPTTPRGLKTGSPPHARGRQQVFENAEPCERITPACAGKTPLPSCMPQRTGDHPRMRGEDMKLKAALSESIGSPPHARGRQGSVTNAGKPFGITPACAGKTFSPSAKLSTDWDHPRMRGED